MQNEQNERHISKLEKCFDKINERYDQYLKFQTEETCQRLITEVVKTVYEYPKFKAQLYNAEIENDLNGDMLRLINNSIKSFSEFCKQNTVTVKFSQYVWDGLKKYVFKNAHYESKSINLTDYFIRKMRALEKFEDYYWKCNGAEPNYTNPEVLQIAQNMTGLTEEQILKIHNINRYSFVSLNKTFESDDDEYSLENMIKDENHISVEEIYENLESSKDLVLFIEAFWKRRTKNNPERRIQISKLFTWNFLKDSITRIDQNIQQEWMQQFEIFDKEMVKKYFSGGYRESFDQKDIAAELGISADYANKLLKERFLNQIKEKYKAGNWQEE